MDIIKTLICFKARPFDHPIKDFLILFFLVIMIGIFSTLLSIFLNFIPDIGHILSIVVVLLLVLVSSPIIIMYAFRTLIAILTLLLRISGRTEEQLNTFQDSLDICNYL